MLLPSSRFFLPSAIALTSLLALTGCQALLKDKSNAGGSGTTSSSKTGASSTSKSSAASTSQSSSKSTNGSGMATGSTGSGCMSGACTNEASATFPVCGGNPVACSSTVCSQYCQAMERCEQLGQSQYNHYNPECCKVCETFTAGNVTAKRPFCCRSEALNQPTPNCTRAGPFGSDNGDTVACGTQAQNVCEIAANICPTVNTPTCLSKCETKLASSGTQTYTAGDMTSDLGKTVTALFNVIDNPGDLTACDEVFNLACN